LSSKFYEQQASKHGYNTPAGTLQSSIRTFPKFVKDSEKTADLLFSAPNRAQFKTRNETQSLPAPVLMLLNVTTIAINGIPNKAQPKNPIVQGAEILVGTEILSDGMHINGLVYVSRDSSYSVDSLGIPKSRQHVI